MRPTTDAEKRAYVGRMRALALLIAVCAAVLVAVASNAPQEPQYNDDWHAYHGENIATMYDDRPANAPTFDWVKGEPIARGCVAPETWTASVSHLDEHDLARIPPVSLVILLDGTRHRVPTGEAWAKAKALNPAHGTGARYWIVGSCK